MTDIRKAAAVTPQAPTPAQLERIRLFTRREIPAEELFVFSLNLCDNEIDRDGEQFPRESLEILAELFIGKTGLFDHNPKAENQSARIFDATVVAESSRNSLGEPYCRLTAWAYMARCEKNADLILEIDAGIKKEVSVGCAVDKITCSVCGANRKTGSCEHQKGKTYGGIRCYDILENPTDAYEWSFVAVPAQKNAGVTKRRGQTMFAQGEGRDLEKLVELARAGEAYLISLRRDVVKLASFAQPGLDPALVEGIAGKLELGELERLHKGFAAAAADKLPPSPQLAGIAPDGGVQNSRFQI